MCVHILITLRIAIACYGCVDEVYLLLRGVCIISNHPLLKRIFN